MRLLPGFCVVILLLVAGCTIGPFNKQLRQEGTISVKINNSANVTHEFEVWVVEIGTNVTVRRNTSYDYKADIDQGLSTRDPGEYHPITGIDFPESAQLHGRYTLNPAENNQSTITKYPSNPAVVVVIYHGDYVISWVSANCGSATLTRLEVTSQYDGSSSTYTCGL